MSAWFELMTNLGINPASSRELMTKERAAGVIQAAFKKWLVRGTLDAQSNNRT